MEKLKIPFCALIAAVMLALCCLLFSQKKDNEVEIISSATAKTSITRISSPKTEEEAKSVEKVPAKTVSVMIDNEKTEMDAEEYIVGVVAGEVYPTFSPEALKAQAVAARTYLYYKMDGGGCAKGADICTDSKHCQAYKSDEKMRSQWGENYEKYLKNIREAVESTAGEILTYGSKPICALYHSSSVGKTEDCVSVFGGNRPYLVSVNTPIDTEKYTQEKSFTKDEFVSKINAAFPDLSIDKIDLKIISFTDAGRVSTVKIGEKSIKATALRKALDLRSTDFTFRIADGKIIFTQRGYGHGVGMSQHGAQALALSGKTYSEILLHYYTGCKIEKR